MSESKDLLIEAVAKLVVENAELKKRIEQPPREHASPKELQERNSELLRKRTTQVDSLNTQIANYRYDIAILEKMNKRSKGILKTVESENTELKNSLAAVQGKTAKYLEGYEDGQKNAAIRCAEVVRQEAKTRWAMVRSFGFKETPQSPRWLEQMVSKIEDEFNVEGEDE